MNLGPSDKTLLNGWNFTDKELEAYEFREEAFGEEEKPIKKYDYNLCVNCK